MPSWGVTWWQRSLVDACFFYCQAPRHLAMVYFFLTSIKILQLSLQMISQRARKKPQSSDKSIRARRICCAACPHASDSIFSSFFFPGWLVRAYRPNSFWRHFAKFRLKNRYGAKISPKLGICFGLCPAFIFGAKFSQNAKSVLGLWTALGGYHKYTWESPSIILGISVWSS